jgi:hypothetical protein
VAVAAAGSDPAVAPLPALAPGDWGEAPAELDEPFWLVDEPLPCPLVAFDEPEDEEGPVEAEGTVADGTVAAGVLTVGVVTVGVVTFGVVTVGVVTAGVVTVGVVTAGVVTVGAGGGTGTVTDGTVTGGTVTVGTVTCGTVTDGTPVCAPAGIPLIPRQATTHVAPSQQRRRDICTPSLLPRKYSSRCGRA